MQSRVLNNIFYDVQHVYINIIIHMIIYELFKKIEFTLREDKENVNGGYWKMRCNKQNTVS